MKLINRILFYSSFLVDLKITLLLTAKEFDWWQTEIIYQIYPQSFKDSDGDGIGDLKGIEESVDYFEETGVGVIWLTPIFKSPMADNGYDISDFYDIHPGFGTMADFDSLLRKLKSKNIKLVLDFVPNHSSDECEWFKKSIKKIDPFTDYYVWKNPKEWSKDGKTPIPPNNWISVFEGSAWEYVPERKQFYLHEFLIKQPDFNYRSGSLADEIKKIFRFWLDKGVDGFRMDSMNFIYERNDFPDEPLMPNIDPQQPVVYDSLNHIYTKDEPECYDLLADWRQLFDSYTRKDGHTRLIITEAYSPLPKLVQYYGNSTHPMAHIPFNFHLLLRLNGNSNAKDVEKVINDFIDVLPPNKWANWVLGNHDNHRISYRFNPQIVDGLNMLLLLLPGTAVSYQGDELGMEDMKIRWDRTNDYYALGVGIEKYESVSRDPERTPFQWNSDRHAGFSTTTGRTWLPVNPNFYYLNFENQKKTDRSHWKVYRDLAKLRKTEAFLNGDLETYLLSDWVFAFQRNIPGEEINVIVINFNTEEETANLKSKIADLPSTMDVIVASINSEYKIGDTLTTGETGRAQFKYKTSKDGSSPHLRGFPMRPNSALVLHTNTKKEQHGGASSGASSIDRNSFFVLSGVIVFKYVANLLSF